MFTMEAFEMMLNSTPIGYAYHELIYDNKGIPKDIRILNFNSAYLNILGLKTINKKSQTMFQLFPNLQNEMPGLLDTIVKSMTLKERQFFSGFIPSFNKWVHIYFFSPKENFFIAQLIDVSESKNLELALLQKSHESEKLIQLIPDLVLIIDFSWNIKKVNPSWEKILGYKLDELIDTNIISLIHPKDVEITKTYIQDGRIFDIDHLLRIRLLSKNGHWKHFDWNFTFHEDKMYGIGRDVSSLIEKEEEIYYLSFHDKLTGLYNRAYCEEELKRLDNNRSLPLSIIMGDVNGLKIINDVFGHLAGDKMLISIARILQNSCRKGDIVARWGGDEFIIILPNTSGNVVEEIVTRIMTNCKNNELDLQYVNISLGYAVRESMDVNITQVLVEAENDMYKNKVADGKKVREMIISSMIQFLFDGSYEIKYHIDRIREYLILIANELSLSKEDKNRLLILADTHDIGKISLPKDILGKPGPLNEEEWKEMRKHSETGYRIAKSIPELASVAELILHHHERWDGKGYPHGLKGEEIPYLARVFTIVDAFDAITQNKPYRKAMSFREGLDYLKREKCKQFDPQIVDVFLRVIENRGD